MAYSDRYVYTSVYDSIKALLVAGTITDSPTITASNSDKEFTKPTVAIYPVDKDETNRFFGDNEGSKILNVVIDCHNLTARNAKKMMEDVEYILKNNKIAGLCLNTITSNYNSDLVSDTKMKYISSTFTYKRR